jgi:Zn-dependent protease with chaperone function
MKDSQQAITFHLVFDGRLVPGRNAAEVEAEFVRRFGAATAKSLFSGKPVTLNRDLRREDAQKKQRILEQLGVVVQIVPASTVSADLSLVEAPTQPTEKVEVHPTPDRQVGKPQESDFGVLPDRSPVAPVESVKSNVYSKAELADAFKDAAEVPAASHSYLVKLIPVTALMLLLPLIYVGITLLSGAGVFWVAVEGFSWAIDNRGTLRLLGVSSALLGMLLLTAFLLRPLVARVDRGPQPVRLDPTREPILFELVDRITDAVGAPMPDEILVDSQANASAHLTHGAFSKSLTLTIGMPLIYGLDLQSLTGVLAHEFGHFTQRAGMRSSALVHQINYWFYRQVHERDSWDRFVDRWLDTEYAVLTLAAALAQMGSFLVRMLLHLLSMLASLFSFSLSREMEYDADRYEISLVGSSAYETTATAMRILSAGHQVAVNDVSLAFDSDKKVDNLPKLAALKAAKFTDKDRQAIMADVEEVNTSIFDTHPSDQARIRKAVEADAQARFVHTGPAEKLLREPDRLSKLVTLQWYRSFGIDVSPDELTPLEEFASETDLLNAAGQSIRDYFGDLNMAPQYLPLMTSGALAKLDDAQLLATLENAKDTLVAGKTEFMLLRHRMDEDVEYQVYYRQALFWRRADFDIDLNAYRLPLTTTDVSEITAKLADYKASEIKSRAALRRCVELQGQRLSFGLEVACRNSEVGRDEVEGLRRTYSAMSSTEGDIARLQECGERIDLLLQVLEALPDEQKYRRQLQSDHATNEQLQQRIRTSLGNLSDPFADGASLGDVLPDEYDGPGERVTVIALEDAARILRSLARTRDKLLGRMCEIALAIS